jgi:hypothetical protein
MTDAADDPYRPQIRPFVLACTDCGEVEPVKGLRFVEGGTENTPYDPLCGDCTGIERRVWGNRRLTMFEPEPHPLDGGTLVLCPRCNGEGRIEPYGLCFRCQGERYDYLDATGVRRTARWWQTYQQNRVPAPDPAGAKQ